MNINDEIIKRIEKTKELLSKLHNKNTMAYLQGLNSLKCDYEILEDYDNACYYAKEIIDLLSHNKIEYKDTKKDEEIIRNIWVHAYDTRARQGDYEAFCIAMEWNRPINKQFYLPRARLLKKHGVVEGIQDLIDDKLDLLVLNLPPRIGKELSDDTPILTKNGWKNHGDLIVGDYVLNDKGEFVMVQALSPKCKSEYIVTFSNGDKIECHGNHEWIVYDRHACKNKIIETKDMIGKIRDISKNNPSSTHRHFRFLVNNRNFVKGEYKELPVKPYTLGAWLGDGANTNPYLSNAVCDRAIVDSIVNDGYSVRHDWVHKTTGVHTVGFNNLRFSLQKLGFCHSRKRVPKKIPDEYLTADINQRLELLAGLLDTDGSLVKKEHRYHFVTAEQTLRDSFVSLINTFGWRCSVTKHQPKTSSSNIRGKQPYWDIGFNPTYYIPCRLERKRLYEFSKNRRISIVSIEPLLKEKWGRCIQVEGGVYLAGKSMIPTHNSTVGLFLQVLLGSMSPNESIIGSGHSARLIQSFYSEIINLMTDPEYRYHEIFPNNKIVDKSSEYNYIDLNSKKRFHTYNYVSIETGGTGSIEASRLLYCDDLVKDVEQANNPDRLEKLYHNYTGTIKDRKLMRLCKDGVYRPCPEIHINTPWSLYDVTSRVVQNAKDEHDMSRVRIISIPCYDENGESNFMYDYGKGFNAKYYKEMELAEDPVIFSAKYLMEPIERDGIVFSKDNVSFYNNLPGREPDRIVGYADVSHGGSDYFSLPIGYVYGYEVYIEDVLFINQFGGDDVSRPQVRDIIMSNNVTRCGIEKNNGGDFYATLVEKDLKEKGYRCHITTHNAPTNKSKRDRILACQNEIKGIASESNTYRLYFKSPDKIKGNRQYQEAMNNLFKWNQNPSVQNKQHDDFPDSLAGLITNVLGGKTKGVAKSNVTADMLGI